MDFAAQLVQFGSVARSENLDQVLNGQLGYMSNPKANLASQQQV